jgi:hypothetical protein
MPERINFQARNSPNVLGPSIRRVHAALTGEPKVPDIELLIPRQTLEDLFVVG